MGRWRADQGRMPLLMWCITGGNEALDNGKSVRALFADYAKAFDHVDHGTVLKKLNNYGVPAFIINWLVSFLRERQQRVKIGDVLSDGSRWVRGSGHLSSSYQLMISGFKYQLVNMWTILQFPKQWLRIKIARCSQLLTNW